MTILEIAKKLASEGHKIKYRRRSDGGFIITQIDNVRYTRAGTGNKVARQLTGEDVSNARAIQLKNIASVGGRLASPAARKAKAEASRRSVSAEVEKEIQKAVRKINTLTRKNERRSGAAGYVSARSVRYWVSKLGQEEADRRLKERKRYAKGLAYGKVVESLFRALASYMYRADGAKKKALEDVYRIIEKHASDISDDAVYNIYQLLYAFDKGEIESDALLNGIRVSLKEHIKI